MQEKKNRIVSLIVTLVLLGLNLVALNYLLAGWTGARIDLTEEGVFSISPATRSILGSLEEDLVIYGYFSKRTHPKLAPLVPQIVDLLDEYRSVSGGRVALEIIDPGEDEEAEQQAADRFGVRSTPFQLASKYETGIVNAYFALVVRYGDQYERYGFLDLIEVEPLPDGDIEVRLRNLEYDLTRAIKKTVYGFRSAADLFDRIDGPVRLTTVITPNSLPEIFADVPEAVETAVEELQAKGGDKFVFERIDPTDDPAMQRELESRFGMRPMSLGFFSQESFYLYALLEAGERFEQIVLTSDSVSAADIREAIESSLRRNTPGFLKTVGVVTSDPEEIPPQLRMQMGMPPTPPPEFEEIKRFLGQEYTVTDVRLDGPEGVPSTVDMLLVLKPKNLTDAQVYALDQYLMRGGRVVVCAGNYEASFGSRGLDVTPLTTGLDDWLAHQGIKLGQSLVLDDRNEALPIPETRYTALGAMRTWTLAPYPYLVKVRDDGFLNRDITASLDSVGIYWGSPVIVDEEVAGEREVIPLLQSSSRSWTDDDLTRVGYVDYTVPEEGTRPHLLAVALSGRFQSYFADKPAPGEEPATSDDADDPGTAASRVTFDASPETRLVVVGNGEFVNDFVARSIGQTDGGFFVENLRFVMNLIDWVALDNDMIGIRSRGLASRRIERVEKGAEITIETANYLIPAVVLIALGLYRQWRRRNTVPMFETQRSTAVKQRSSREGV